MLLLLFACVAGGVYGVCSLCVFVGGVTCVSECVCRCMSLLLLVVVDCICCCCCLCLCVC